MTDHEFLALNQRGFIPGPNESEEAFFERIDRIRVGCKDALPQAHWNWVMEQLSDLYDIEPESLVAVYSNKNLTWWQGAACWIGEDGVPRLQLREGFRKGSYLGYSREEVLAHEAIHAARVAFAEEENEEFFAYASSSKRWRRVLGPLFKRPWEAWLLMGGLAGSLWSELATLFVTCLIGTGFWRLIRQHRRLRKASDTLMVRLKDERKVRAVLFRLTDAEIRSLSRGEWIEGDTTLRWRLIRLAYIRDGETGV